MKRFLAAIVVVLALLAGLAAWRYARATRRVAAEPAVSEAAADRMARKLAFIAEQAGRPQRSPTTTILLEEEINSYFEYRMGGRIPAGVSQVRFDLHPDRPSATAMVDFDQVKAASRRAVNPLLDQLLSGRRPVAVAARFTSANGSGLFHLEEVSLGSLTLRGALLDLVVRHFVQPRYPKAAIDRPFALPAQIDQWAVEEAQVRIYQK